jgi:hypothetical protein
LTLEEFRIQLLKQIRGCQDSLQAQELIVQAQLALKKSRLKQRTIQAFWLSMNKDLMVLEEGTVNVRVGDALAARTAVITAARAAISRYQNPQ